MLACVDAASGESFMCGPGGGPVPSVCHNAYSSLAECSCNLAYAGDGRCDSGNNIGECGWDGGDCCASTCQPSTYGCDGTMDCRDPAAQITCADLTSAGEDWTGTITSNCGGTTPSFGPTLRLNVTPDLSTADVGGVLFSGTAEADQGTSYLTLATPMDAQGGYCELYGAVGAVGTSATGGVDCYDAAFNVLCSGTWQAAACHCSAGTCCACCDAQTQCGSAAPKKVDDALVSTFTEGGNEIITSTPPVLPGCPTSYSLTVYFHGIDGYSKPEVRLLQALSNTVSDTNEPCCVRELGTFMLQGSRDVNANASAAGNWIIAQMAEAFAANQGIVKMNIHLIGFSAGGVVASAVPKHIPCTFGTAIVETDLVTIASPFNIPIPSFLPKTGKFFAKLLRTSAVLTNSIGAEEFAPGELPACLCRYKALITGSGDSPAGGHSPANSDNFNAAWKAKISPVNLPDHWGHVEASILSFKGRPGGIPGLFDVGCQCIP